MKPHRSLSAFLLLTACDSGCANNVLASAMAPGGKHGVAMFERDCGATTGFSTQISILGADQGPTEGGNVFVADHGSTPTAWGGPWAEIAWLAPDRLLIRYDSRARIFKQVARIDGVSVRYESVMR